MFGFRNRKKYNGSVDVKLNNEYQIPTQDNPKFPGVLQYLALIDESWNNYASEDECAMQIATLYVCGLFRQHLWEEARLIAERMDHIGPFGIKHGLIRSEVWDKCIALVEKTQREVSVSPGIHRTSNQGSARPVDDLEAEADALLRRLQPCAPQIVVASPRYSGNYRCEVIVETSRLAPFVEHLVSGTVGGNRKSKIARLAFPKWLRSQATTDTATSYLPAGFVDVISAYPLNFVMDGTASVYCPDCDDIVDKVNTSVRNRQQAGPWSEWTSGWCCPLGHLLYVEDHELHILRRSEP